MRYSLQELPIKKDLLFMSTLQCMCCLSVQRLVEGRTHPCSFSSSWSHSHNPQSTRIRSLQVCWCTCPVHKDQERCGIRRCLKAKTAKQSSERRTTDLQLLWHSFRQTIALGQIWVHKADLCKLKKWNRFTSLIEVVNYVTIIEPKGNKTVRSVADSSGA